MSNVSALAANRLARGGALGFVGVIACVFIAAAMPLGTRGTAYLAIHIVCTVLAACVWWALTKLSGDAQQRAARWVLLMGLAARIVLLPAPTFTTHDPARYLFDGKVLLSGLDPYRTSPDDMVDRLPEWRVSPEHARYVTLYPPGALLVFAACAAGGPELGPWLWKGVTTAASIALCLLLGWLVWLHQRWPAMALVALNPLLILEAGVGAHVDVLAASMLIAGLALWTASGSATRMLALLGVGVLFKLSPGVAAVPVFARSPRSVLMGLGGMLTVGYGGALLAGLRPWGSTGVFLNEWRFGAPIIAAVEPWLGEATVPVAITVGIAALLALALWVRHRDTTASLEGMAHAMAMSLALLFALSPMVFPWYLLPLAALLPLTPRPWIAAWITLHPLTYEVIDRFEATGAWEPATWPLVLIALGWLTARAPSLSVETTPAGAFHTRR